MSLDHKNKADLARVKSLLFDEEQELLGRLAQRLDEVESDFRDDEQLSQRVAGILSDALREAEIADHDTLAQSMAPLVVATIRSEIVNSRDQMVEALYPITGQLVSAYVSNAMRDLMTDINRRLESGLSGRRLFLRGKSLLTGQPYGELLLAELNAPRVEELYLIRRSSGELIDRWMAPAPISEGADKKVSAGTSEPDADEHLVGSFLTAITEFSREAFKADQASLQTLDLKRYRIFLRASPAHLVAAKCHGHIPRNVERALDNVFVEILAEHADALAGAEATTKADLLTVLPDFAARFEEQVADITTANQSSGNGFAVALVSAIALLALGWIGWTTAVNWHEESVRNQILSMKNEIQEFRGFPVTVNIDDLGARIALEGLAPSVADKNRLLARIRHERKPRALADNLVVITDIDTARLLRAQTEGLARRVETTEEILSLSAKTDAVTLLRQNLEGLEQRLTQVARRSGEVRERTEAISDGMAALASRSSLEEVDRQLLALDKKLVRLQPMVSELRKLSLDQSLMEAAQLRTDEKLKELAAIPQLLEAVGVLSQDIAAMRQSIATRVEQSDLARIVSILETMSIRLVGVEARPVPQPIDGLETRIRALESIDPESPRQQFEKFAKSNAIFFSQGEAFRDEAAARRKLARLAEILRAGAIPVRIVGYTDQEGTANVNQRLASSRADSVANILTELGVPPGQIVSVGRAELLVVSDISGPDSPNRRVEFEFGFESEPF